MKDLGRAKNNKKLEVMSEQNCNVGCSVSFSSVKLGSNKFRNMSIEVLDY